MPSILNLSKIVFRNGWKKDKAKKRKDKLAEIENKVKDCQNKCAIDPSVDNFSELEEIQSQYNTIYDYIA